MKNQQKQQGMTLIELMISLLIGIFLIGGVLKIFTNTRQTYRVQSNLSGMQENGRFAMDFLSKDIRTAGFLGCNIDATLHNILAANFLYDFGTAIEGFESTSATVWSPVINAAITTPLGGSDVITIRRAGADSFTVATHALATDPLTLNAATTDDLQTAGFLKDDGTNNDAIAVVSNCTDATTFQVTGIAGGGLIFSHNASGDNTTNDLGATYPNSQIYTINTISYYVRTGPNNTPSLYKRVGEEDAVELIEGIENMQILYGEDTDTTEDGTPNYYVPADQVVDMGKVVSVRISLLVRSMDDNLTTAPRAYTYNGATTTPTDRRLRRVFTTTIALRNRLP